MEFPKRFVPKKREDHRDDSCKIIVKRKKDGTVIKEIKGKCSREQLEVLSQSNVSQQ
jgi:hypothetical protein